MVGNHAYFIESSIVTLNFTPVPGDRMPLGWPELRAVRAVWSPWQHPHQLLLSPHPPLVLSVVSADTGMVARGITRWVNKGSLRCCCLSFSRSPRLLRQFVHLCRLHLISYIELVSSVSLIVMSSLSSEKSVIIFMSSGAAWLINCIRVLGFARLAFCHYSPWGFIVNIRFVYASESRVLCETVKHLYLDIH